MPRFPDYVAQEGLSVPSAPQIEANIAVGRSLNDFGQTLEEAGRRFAARRQQQADFDDQIAYQRYTLAQGQALQQAQAGMAPEATGFHDAVMAGRTQADDAFLGTLSPANRERYASEGAVVFEGLDYFMIWFLLMIKRYDVLARHYVDLRGEHPSQQEIIALLRQRTRRITPESAR